MPALVVWERLVVAGDDLRCVSSLFLVLDVLQMSLIVYVLARVFSLEHRPDMYVLAGCLRDENAYWRRWHAGVAGCAFVLSYGVVGFLADIAVCRTSGRGTPTEVGARRRLVPLYKCKVAPLLLCRALGFAFASAALSIVEGLCACVRANAPAVLEGMGELEETGRGSVVTAVCPLDGIREAARVLTFTMAVDVLFPAVTLVLVLHRRVFHWYRRLKPARERELEEQQRLWQGRCNRCCALSSFLTCYTCGGQKLTAGSYADVAIALTDFFVHDDLDLVPSDIAAALICLMSVQRRKQIEYKNELLREGGRLAKDRGMAIRLWRQVVAAFATASPVNDKRASMQLQSLVRASIMCEGDLEAGLGAYKDDGSQRLEDISLTRTTRTHIEEEEEHTRGSDHFDGRGTMASSTLEELRQTQLQELRQTMLVADPTDTQLDEFRDTMLSCVDVLDFTPIQKDESYSTMSFLPTVSKVLTLHSPFDCLVLREGRRYCKVALASYSWFMYLWTNKLTGLCKLTADSICHRRCCGRPSDNIVGDNICGWKEATVLLSLGFDSSDVLYANFSNDVGVNPYLIIRDRKCMMIVVTIRGTLSFEDMISDVSISPQPLESMGEQFGFDGRGEFCHSGMLAGAQWIYDDLKKHNALEKAINDHPDFGLRVIGHSLGAGVAAVLGRMLRKQFPKLYCLCFSPPGCVFSKRTAQESTDYVCSYVLHDDMVARLSYDSLSNLRNNLIEMVERIKVPKHKVFDVDWTPLNEDSLLSLPEKLLHAKEEIPESKFSTEFEEFKTRQAQRQEERDQAHIKMTVPGRILHMVRTSTNLNNIPCSCLLSCAKCINPCGKTKKYKLQWSEAELFTEIDISPTMMSDHFPFNVARALEFAAESYEIEDQVTDFGKHDQSERVSKVVKKDR